MSHFTISMIFDTRLQAWAASKSLHVVYRNEFHQPVDGEIYLRVFTLPAGTESSDLKGKHRAYVGVYQISIIGPAGRGAVAIGDLVDELAELFPLNERQTRKGLTVQVMTPLEQGPDIQDDTRFTIPVSFQYRADV
jgi:hypothetical protein